MDQQALYEKGLNVRKAVLGEAHVERSLAKADSFDGDLQDIVTKYCWGEVWTRPGLSLRERSLMNLCMITALNRPNELKLHVRGAVNNGLSREDIREALLQAMIYCGVPAGIDSFRIAREELANIDAE